MLQLFIIGDITVIINDITLLLMIWLSCVSGAIGIDWSNSAKTSRFLYHEPGDFMFALDLMIANK